jgi:hypothetical protein
LAIGRKWFTCHYGNDGRGVGPGVADDVQPQQPVAGQAVGIDCPRRPKLLPQGLKRWGGCLTCCRLWGNSLLLDLDQLADEDSDFTIWLDPIKVREKWTSKVLANSIHGFLCRQLTLYLFSA